MHYILNLYSEAFEIRTISRLDRNRILLCMELRDGGLSVVGGKNVFIFYIELVFFFCDY